MPLKYILSLPRVYVPKGLELPDNDKTNSPYGGRPVVEELTDFWDMFVVLRQIWGI